ncbi:DUF397 domain-containing protein [Streptomyces sp. 2MCAF27]
MRPDKIDWFKSSYSGPNGGCVETRYRADDAVDLRDSKDLLGPVLTFAAAEWSAFVKAAKTGEFNSRE